VKASIRRCLRTALAGSLLFGGTVVTSVIAGSLPASAATTVEYVAAGGSDTGSCQSAASPCATISYAYLQTSYLSSSTTIDVGPGVFPVALCVCGGGGYPYAENLTIQGSASGAAPATTLDGQALAERGSLTLENLTVNGESGVAVSASYGGSIQVVDSTVTNSQTAIAEDGPGAEVSLMDSTISGNAVALDLMNPPDAFSALESTIADNGAGLEGIGDLNLADTIVSNNDGHDCALSELNFFPVADDGYNIGDDGTCDLTATTSRSDTPAGLDPSGLQNNGGPTQTILPATGSPAIGAVPTGTTLNGVQVCPRTDQRGVASVGNCTIGAVEVHQCASGLTAHVLNASYRNGSFTGLFCVNTEGSGTYTQGTVSGWGSVTTVRGTTIVGAFGKNLLLRGATNGTRSGFVEVAPLKAIGTFTLN
jgi:hypothetical protein